MEKGAELDIALAPVVEAELLAVAALDGPSYEGCPGDLGQPFVPWGDEASYSLAPGGSFETDSDPWYLTGDAQVTDGNEPFHLNGSGDSHLLSLPSFSTATTVPICITRDHPNFRFFALSEGSDRSRLRVEVLFYDHQGNLHSPRVGAAIDTGEGIVFDSGTLVHSSGWQLSPQLPVVANEYLEPGQSDEIAIRVTPIGRRSSWSLDDVYIDPRHRN